MESHDFETVGVFFDSWRFGKTVFYSKIYFQIAGYFLISRGLGDMKFAHERTCSNLIMKW